MLCRARVYLPRGMPSARASVFPVMATSTSALCVSYRLCATTAKPAAQQQPSSAEAGSSSAPRLRVDPSRLPRTIPGLSPEELAARIEVYQAQLMEQEAQMSVQQMEAETEMMRRSLSPEGFEEYLERTEAMHAKVAKEAAKMVGMTPEELYRYQQKQRRKIVRYEWYKTLMLVFVFVASLFFLFFFFIFFT